MTLPAVRRLESAEHAAEHAVADDVAATLGLDGTSELVEAADAGEPEHHHRLEIGLPALRESVGGGLRLIVETVLVPTLLFTVGYHVGGLTPALAAALTWCYGVLALRLVRRRGTPGTLLLMTGIYTVRAGIAFATSSAFLFLVQPIIGSAAMAAVFVGSALVGKPITARLARDFVRVPAHVADRTRVRRMFRDVALLWGLGRVLDATMSLLLLHHSIDAGLLGRGVFSPLLTAVMIGACSFWGWRSLRRDGVSVRRLGRQGSAQAA